MRDIIEGGVGMVILGIGLIVLGVILVFKGLQ